MDDTFELVADGVAHRLADACMLGVYGPNALHLWEPGARRTHCGLVIAGLLLANDGPRFTTITPRFLIAIDACSVCCATLLPEVHA